MAYEGQQPCNYHAKAENDLSSKQFFAVELSGDSQVDITDDVLDNIAGVLQSKPKAGEYGTVCPLGITKVKAGGTLAAGNKLTVASGGFFIQITTAGSGVKTQGFCIDGCASGGLATAFVHCANAVSSVTSVP